MHAACVKLTEWLISSATYISSVASTTTSLAYYFGIAAEQKNTIDN